MTNDSTTNPSKIDGRYIAKLIPRERPDPHLDNVIKFIHATPACQHVTMVTTLASMQRLCAEFSALEPRVMRGSMSHKERLKNIEEFASGNVKLLVLMRSECGRGYKFTGSNVALSVAFSMSELRRKHILRLVPNPAAGYLVNSMYKYR